MAEIKAPTPQEIRAAALTLMRAWAPGILAVREGPARDEDDEDEFYDNGCGCAGTDEDGEPLGCNCAPGCGCPDCAHWSHEQMARCWARGCDSPTRFRITGWSPARVSIRPDPGDDGPCDEHGLATLGDGGAYDYWSKAACGTAHVRELIEHDQAYRGDASRLKYRVEPWRYEPDVRDMEDRFGEDAAHRLSTIRSIVGSLDWSSRDVIVDRWHGDNGYGAKPKALAGDIAWIVLLRDAAMLADAVAGLDPEILEHGLPEGGDS